MLTLFVAHTREERGFADEKILLPTSVISIVLPERYTCSFNVKYSPDEGSVAISAASTVIGVVGGTTKEAARKGHADRKEVLR